MKRGSSGLTLRECQTYHKALVELTPRKVSQWVKNLPVVNLGDSARNVYRLLMDINQSLLEEDKRMALLEILEPVAEELVISLEKRFAKNHIALNEKNKKIAALVQAIQTELFLGYQAAIESVLVGGLEAKRSKKKILTLALAQSIKYHGLVILRCYQLYTSVPGRMWRELYCLYQIAINQEIQNIPVKVSHSQEVLVCHDYFIRILLLGTANTYQLRQQEIQLLWDILPQLSPHAVLKSHAYNTNHFVVSLDSPLPPIHKSLYKIGMKGQTVKLMASTLTEHLDQMLLSIKQSGQESARKTMLLRHLIQCWGSDVHRSFARTSCNEFLDICIGLGATHYLLMQNDSGKVDATGARDTLEAMEGSLKHVTLLDVSQKEKRVMKKDVNYLSSSVPSDDVWAKLYRPEQAMKNALNEMNSNMRSRDTIVKDTYKLQTVSLLNMSPGGYCLQLDSEALPKHAQTGEILGLLEFDPKGGEHWSVGIVRWVRRQSKGTIIQMGVQLLAPSAIPINVQLRDSKSNVNDFQRALILPELTGIGQPATLLANSLSFNMNNKVRIVDNDEEYDARLTKEVISSGSFKQFQFEKLDKDKQKNDTRVNPVRDPSFDSDELQDVWDLI